MKERYETFRFEGLVFTLPVLLLIIYLMIIL